MSSNAARIAIKASPGKGLTGKATIPGDKSISHRALILGAMAVGETTITGLLEGEDVLQTAQAMRALGAEVERASDGTWHVYGVGVGGFGEPCNVIDCGNSGTGVRLLMGAVATHPFAVTFTGDASLVKRPMERVVTPLEGFGTRTVGRSGNRLPLTLVGAQAPVPLRYRVPVPSAQVKSAILLAGLNAPGETIVIEEQATRDHTERMLAGFGADITTEITPEGRVITLKGMPELIPQNIAVPSDPSSAAFPVCAALIVPGSEVLVPHIGLNPTRAGLFTTLQEMGANLTFENMRTEGGEPTADLRACYSPQMHGITVPAERAASMIDEYPILGVVAANANGETRMPGVAELRVKESDRIAAMADGLRAAGVAVEDGPDWWQVRGDGPGSVPGGMTAKAHMDHRIAMSFLILGLAAKTAVQIDDAAPIATSFPTFVELMRSLGAELAEVA